jgi:hypothetical protein
MSYVESLVKQKLNPRVGDTTPAANRITVRLDDKAHWKLVTMSTRFGMSKSATAEDLLESAIADAFKVYFDMLADEEKAHILCDSSMHYVVAEFSGEEEALELAGDEETLKRLFAIHKSKHPDF